MSAEKNEKKLVPNGGYPMHTFDDLKELYYIYIKHILYWSIYYI